MDVAADDDLAITCLRRATRQRHAALEDVLQLVPPLSRSRYLDALRGFDVFLAMWEPQIEAVLSPALRPWFRSASRRPLLREDLRRLGQAPGATQPVEHACEQALAGVELVGGGVFGSIYVLEGSALGGRVIAKLAADALGLGRHNGAAYFSGQDGQSAARWATFRRLLKEQVGTEPQARQQACRATCRTFDALNLTFSRVCRDEAVT